MNFQTIYRASFYLMLTFATLVLSVDATDDNPFAMLYPPVVAAASVLAFATVDRNPKLGLNRNTANLLAFLTPIPSFLEWFYGDNLLLLAAAHWLVYLQLVKTFLPKTVEDDWFLFMLGMVEVLVGGVMSQSDKVGIALFTWALLALWVLILFALHREALRMKGTPMGISSGGVANPSEPYRGLIDAPFAFSTARVAAMTLAMGGLIFLATPRRNSMGSTNNTGVTPKHLTGFGVEIKLGELGEILENDSPVMSVEVLDVVDGQSTPRRGTENRWRGVSLDGYRDGKWSRHEFRPTEFTIGLRERLKGKPLIRQTIKMEPTTSQVLFGLRPICYIFPERRLELIEADGSLYRPDTRAVTIDYVLESFADTRLPQPGEQYPSAEYLRQLTTMPAALKQKLRPIALELVKEIDEDDIQGQAEAIERYLRDSGEFVYSLQMEQTDPSIDPVEDFLINRKSGHCEYFASALALMLRSIDIPSRMINGFKGGDYNEIAGITTVRQKHAHSWVEALIDRTTDSEQQPIWMTLDPTPADQRNASVARVGGLANKFYLVTDFIRYIWVFYIVGFNSERQDRFLYAPIRALIAEALRGFDLIGKAIRGWLHFPSVESFFSLRGFLVSFTVLLMLVGLGRLVVWLVQRLLRRLQGPKGEDSSGLAAIQFYRRLVRLLAEYGLDRPPAETPLEFARRAAVFLSGHGSGTETVADVPAIVVDAFYRIRFGEHTIREDDFDRVNARLDALEAHLHPSKA